MAKIAEMAERSIAAVLYSNLINFAEMAERSNAAVLKTVEGQPSGGSNPSLCAKINRAVFTALFILLSMVLERDLRVEPRA